MSTHTGAGLNRGDTAEDLTVYKRVVVNRPREEAFELFTAGLASWWPFETHSPANERPEEVVFEERVGGRVYDRLASGEEHEWATVSAWEPPERFVLDWHVSRGRPSTELEVRFEPEDSGTRVELEHRGWERHADEAAETHRSYDEGWDTVLGRYVAAANG
jgi:uncharacterized protein YndB with AHSA1/START domain